MGYRAEQLFAILRSLTPTLLGILGVLILALPIRFFEGALPTPIIPLVVVFFWSIYSPDFLPSPSVFAIGLLQDLLMGGPLGLWASVYLVTQFAVSSQRAYFLGREQKVVWMGFALAAAVASLMLWLVMSLMSGALLPVGALSAQVAVTILIYPLFGAAFRELHSRVLVEV